MASGLYEIVHVCSGRRYIGSAVNIDKRWREHVRQLSTGKHHSKFMQRVWNKDGKDSFRFSVLIWCARADLLFYEQLCLDSFKPEFNSAPVAGSQLGYRHSDETRRRMSQSRPKDFSPMTGKTHTAETRARISASRKGKGGGPRSPERLAKIGAAHKGRPKSAEHRAKIAATLKGTKTGRGKLNEGQVREIRRLKENGLRKADIAMQMQIRPSWVNTVVDGHAYGWVK